MFGKLPRNLVLLVGSIPLKRQVDISARLVKNDIKSRKRTQDPLSLRRPLHLTSIEKEARILTQRGGICHFHHTAIDVTQRIPFLSPSIMTVRPLIFFNLYNQ